jgi:hypothetical protein
VQGGARDLSSAETTVSGEAFEELAAYHSSSAEDEDMHGEGP